MRNDWRGVATVVIGLALAATGSPAQAEPRVFLHDGQALAEARQQIEQHPGEYGAILEQMRAKAEEAMDQGPWSVTDKQETPPSGDERDYMSQGPFWWPNPDTDDGLPYIRRDGVRNPEVNDLDSPRMGRMTRAVTDLAWAYYFSGEQRFAERAAYVLRIWFLDEEKGMNPHLEYGQRIPGRTEGRGIGIIDTRRLTELVDAVGLLAESQAWTEDDQAALEAWFAEYLTWLLESEHGADERRHPNNHGTWYDVQVASFALFTDQPDIARRTLANSREVRIEQQAEADGRQPLELRRTRPWSYSIYNLRGYVALGHLSEKVDVDVWAWESEQGHSLRQCLEYLLAYAKGEKEWDYAGIEDPDYSRLGPLLWKAGRAYDEPAYRELAAELIGEHAWPTAEVRVRYPMPASD